MAVVEGCAVSAKSDPVKWPVLPHKGRALQTLLLLGRGKFSLISCFFFEYSFIVWPRLGLSFVSAKPCSQLVLASRDLRPPAILLGSLHSLEQ